MARRASASSPSPAPRTTRTRCAPRALVGAEPVALWHRDPSLHGVDAVILPGGFSYGDYLRCGAIARFSPVMEAVIAAAREGLPVLGICNGFQMLCESHLLPGALIRNAGTLVHQPGRAAARRVDLDRVDLGLRGRPGDPDPDQERRGQVRRRRAHAGRARGRGPGRRAVRRRNPNGSARDIAGIAQRRRATSSA